MDPPLCANGCGFYGSSESNNLCSQCYKEHLLTCSRKITKLLLKNNTVSSSLVDDQESLADDQDLTIVTESEASNSDSETKIIVETSINELDALDYQKKKKRCKSCKKKVGLLGFECRCGNLFCGRHRYPEEHSCTVDYKQIGRQLLLKQNPTCEADKMNERL